MVINTPYILYKSQKEYVTDIISFLKDKDKSYLLQEGPTGMGKTVCNLMGALYWIRKDDRRVIYFTREHTQIEQCMNDLRLLIDINDHDVRAVHIAGRSFSCLRSEVTDLIDEEEQLITCEELHTVICNYSGVIADMENRPLDKGCIYTLKPEYTAMYYQFDVEVGDTAISNIMIDTHLNLTYVHDIVDELFANGIASNEVIMAVAEKYIICPRKLQNMAMNKANIIFAPYPYMILDRIFHKDENDYLYIIDEAHNLDQDLTSMQSFKISKRTIQSFIRVVTTRYAEDRGFVESTHGLMYQIGNIFQNDVELAGESLKNALKDISEEHFLNVEAMVSLYVRKGIRRRVIRRASNPEPVQPTHKSFITMQKFMTAMRRSIENINSAIIKVEGQNIFIRFVDTDIIFKMATKLADKVMISSGTLYPLYMHKYLGLDNDSAIRKAYDPPHKKLIGTGSIIEKVDGVYLNTRYSERSVEKFVAIAKVIKEIHTDNQHGTLVFFPSYSYQDGVGDILSSEYGISYYKHERVKEYRSTISRGGQALFMTAFRGKGSEGWNFPDDESRAIILCGTPFLPMNDIMVKAQMEYYENKHRGLGITWYRQKAVLWLVQAFGRGFRHSDDWCRVYFLDDRVSKLRKYFPKWVRKAIIWAPKQWNRGYGR